MDRDSIDWTLVEDVAETRAAIEWTVAVMQRLLRHADELVLRVDRIQHGSGPIDDDLSDADPLFRFPGLSELQAAMATATSLEVAT